jgi:hypothetical protein
VRRRIRAAWQQRQYVVAKVTVKGIVRFQVAKIFHQATHPSHRIRNYWLFQAAKEALTGEVAEPESK